MSGRGASDPVAATPRSVLVIITRRIGDVLLATPLIRSIKAAWLATQIDALVFAGTEGALAANPDLRRVITIAQRPQRLNHLRFLASLARRYDIALSCGAGDRSTLYAWIAGRWRAGFVEREPKAFWKSWLLSKTVPFDDLDTHTVAMNLALADAIGIAPSHEVVAAWSGADAARVDALFGQSARNPYAVLHLYPKFNYKMWHVEGWVGLAQHLVSRHLTTVITGSGDEDEMAFVQSIVERMPVGTMNFAGKLSLSETAALIDGARVFVGPDTATTHIAAARSVPTVAIFGPSNPVKWGPWPRDRTDARSPWRRVGTQTVGNVHLIQGNGACVPCRNEGCDRHVGSYSACLQELPLQKVVQAVDEALRSTPAHRGGR